MSILAALVDKDAVRAQLTARQPELLDDPGSEFFGLFDRVVDGIAEEVAAITTDPPPDYVRGLAIQAVVIGSAADIEASLFPEQLNGDTSRAQYLRDKYVALLAQLKGLSPTRQRSSRVGSVRTHSEMIRTGASVPFAYQPPVQPEGTYLATDQVV